MLATGFGLISGSAEEPPKALPTPKRAPHTITDVGVRVRLGRHRAGQGHRRARQAAGAPGRVPQVFPAAKINPAASTTTARPPRISYSFCFDEKDNLVAKTTRSLPVSVREPSPKADATS